MSFADLRTKYAEESERIARFIVAQGKRRFLIRGSWSAGVTFWLGMNLLLFVRAHAHFGTIFLVGFEVVIFSVSMLFGFFLSSQMWGRYERLSNSNPSQ